MDENICTGATPRRELNFEEADREKEVQNIGEVQLKNEGHLDVSEEKFPKIGMEFESEDAAYKFYNDYAKAAGFGIRKHSAHKDRNGRVLDRIFCCECQGYRPNDKRDAFIKSHRPETRTGCEAKMKINGRYDAKYKVVSFIAEHQGHDLVSPKKVHLKRSHRRISDIQAAQADDLDNSGITPKSGFALLSKQVGGHDNVGFIFQDYKNYLQSKRTVEMKAGDTGGVLEYMQQRQLDNPNFFYAIQVDQDDLIANILWIDAQMKIDYTYFGDVVCFDTTYKKNKEGKPFAIFVGVNHHRQTIIFGAALLYDETTSTFTWLFETFARAMSGKKPKTILTDQDAAMAKALSIKWPETCHRLCIWHIYQNAATHLSNVFAHFKSFSKDFSSCIYNYEEEEEFLSAWGRMLEKYQLQDNEWLERLFKIREKWAMVYGRRTFCADMTTTQRSESMNSVLKRYVSYKHNLLQFCQHFDRLMSDRRYEELKADYRSSHTKPVAAFPVQILKHATNVYTHEVLKLFEDELRKAYDARADFCGQVGEVLEYKITLFEKSYHHTVLLSMHKEEVSCSCKKFEFAGVLCSHVLKVFSLNHIMKIPELYIKKRWTKKAKKSIVEGQVDEIRAEPFKSMNEDEEKKLIGVHYKELCSLYNQLTTRGALTTKTFEIAKKYFVKGIEEIDACLENNKSVVQEDISSRVEDKQTSVFKNIVGEDGETSSAIMVKGWKKKEKNPIRSGKREKRGLEKSQQKKVRKTTTSIENNVQDVGNYCSNSSSIGASAQCVSRLDVSSQQHILPSSVQVSQASNPMINQQLNFTNSNEDHCEMSLTELLQQQHTKMQMHGGVQFYNSTPRN